MTRLILNGKPFSLSEVKNIEVVVDSTTLTPYESKVLTFCQQWLAGQPTFTLPTSGSTGEPKMISLSRAQMQTSARLTGQVLGLQQGNRALVCLAVEYIAGLMMLVRGFELGLDLNVVEPSSNPLAPFPAATHFDFTALVPLQLHQILHDSPEKCPILNRMKAILIGGAPISAALHAQLQSLTAPIYHTYGMTETVTHIALKRLNGPTASDYFTPLPETVLAVDERGCLTIQAPVTNGETLHTNDVVELKPDGSFKWLGRIDHVINSGGVKVQPEQVETALERVLYHQPGQAHRRFLVGPLAHPRLGQAVIALFEGEPFSTEVEAKIRAALRQTLHPYQVPRYFYFTPNLLETATGKIDRLANLARLNEPVENPGQLA
jgi:O-succinylbenzoic acid--CoA ligase